VAGPPPAAFVPGATTAVPVPAATGRERRQLVAVAGAKARAKPENTRKWVLNGLGPGPTFVLSGRPG